MSHSVCFEKIQSVLGVNEILIIFDYISFLFEQIDISIMHLTLYFIIES